MKRLILLALTIGLLIFVSAGIAGEKKGGAKSPDGTVEVAIDLPVGERIKNIGSKKDGAGMCVFSSCEMSMRWANLEEWRGWRDWCAANYPGGGYPEKVDKLIKAYADAKKIPIPPYLQFKGKDLAPIKSALAVGRMPAVTYNANHMVNCVALEDKWACVLDNNYVGEEELKWMSPADFDKTYNAGGGGWCVIFLAPGPPPPPWN